MRRFIPGLWLLLLAAPFAGCGSKSSTDNPRPDFALAAVGPEGALLSAGDVKVLRIKPGALPSPTTVTILPEVADLPITKMPGDPCDYALLGPQWCIGPVGLMLNVGADLRLCYDEALIPPGSDECDLTLLIWDHDNMSYFPVNQGVAQNKDENILELSARTDPAWDGLKTLGHVAVAVRFCEENAIVFTDLAQPGLVAEGSTAGEAQQAVLFVGATDGSFSPRPLSTGGAFPLTFVPSPFGTRVLFDVPGELGIELWSVDTETGTDLQPLAGSSELILSADPLTGWLSSGLDAFFQERDSDVMSLGLGGTQYYFDVVPGNGSGIPSRFYTPLAFYEDVRQSPDGSMVMVGVGGVLPIEEASTLGLIDIFDATTGADISRGIIPPSAGNSPMPRFNTVGDTVYLVDAGNTTVSRWPADGNFAEVTTLVDFSTIINGGYVKDFVLDSLDSRWAAIVSMPIVDTVETPSLALGQDLLLLGCLFEPGIVTVPLGGDDFYDDIIFTPNQDFVLLDGQNQDVRMFRYSNGGTMVIPTIPDLSHVDISATDGRLLFSVQNGKVGDSLIVLDADGTNPTPVPGVSSVGDARWLFTTRRSPGMLRGIFR